MIKQSVVCDHCGKHHEKEFVSLHTAKNPKTSRLALNADQRSTPLTGRMDFCNLSCLTEYFKGLIEKINKRG